MAKERPNDMSRIRNIYAIMSGKGGVGKSSVTSLIAKELSIKGFKVGIFDVDVTGPSIPKIFGIHQKAYGTEEYIEPAISESGVKIISMNLFLEREDAPIIWKGSMIVSTLINLFKQVLWGELDYLLIDMPPGTGDIPISIMQSINLDGAIVVTTPQDLVGLIVKKSINMIKMMEVPIIGVVENMSYIICDNCNKKHYVFGQGNTEKACEELGVKLLDSLPINKDFVALSDEGKIEVFNSNGLIENVIKKITYKKVGITFDNKQIKIYEFKNEKVLSEKVIEINADLDFVQSVCKNEIDLLIVDKVEENFVKQLNKQNVRLVRGITGDIEAVFDLYIQGELYSKDDTKACGNCSGNCSSCN